MSYRRDNQDRIRETRRKWQAERVQNSNTTRRERYAEEAKDPERAAVKRERNRRYYEANREKMLEYARQRRKTKPKSYGFTHGRPYHEIFQELWLSQDGRCYLCGTELQQDVPRAIALDHDHSCCPPGRSCEKCRRGLTCRYCNILVGWADDNPEKLRQIADNLDRAKDEVRHRKSP